MKLHLLSDARREWLVAQAALAARCKALDGLVQPEYLLFVLMEPIWCLSCRCFLLEQDGCLFLPYQDLASSVQLKCMGTATESEPSRNHQQCCNVSSSTFAKKSKQSRQLSASGLKASPRVLARHGRLHALPRAAAAFCWQNPHSGAKQRARYGLSLLT